MGCVANHKKDDLRGTTQAACGLCVWVRVGRKGV